ncbi:pyridoxal-phosphate dependent enzyme [Phytoactinopolyspora limicola]|uniref:pyridoxal-phosphate dependent enzyme n=1 Tax=Phytoactinopolyspora limicola TaxID=2715536 RepID=UPI00140A3048|nr:pyridoxal-phosphate dependent enzyme [Phytoactinopolyspora limicola]
MTSSTPPELTLDLIRSAAAGLAGVAHHTPTVRSRTLDAQVSAEVLVKCESFQRGGSFKFRGAYTYVAAHLDEVRQRGVCTVSSGNHAQAVAITARNLGLRCAVLMPHDAPAAKLEATRSYGAQVEQYDRFSMPQAQAGAAFAERTGLTMVPAYNHPLIAAGAGTAVLEVAGQSSAVDVLLAPIGGGGLISGCGTAVKALSPTATVIGVEAAASAVTQRSLRAGQRVEIELTPHLADGQMLTTPGSWTFGIMQRVVDDVVLVTDDEIRAAMRFLFDRMKLVVEPSGAAACAALLAGKVDVAGQRVAVIVSGGNIGVDRFGDLMTEEASAAVRGVPRPHLR